MKGLASAPRPIETAAQPVSSNVAAASAIVRMSPLATTGMRSTASTTARMPARFTAPLNPCWRVRPCTITPATPTCSKARASSGRRQRLVVPAQPHLDRDRDLTRHRRRAVTRSTARSIWHMSAEPPPVLTTFRTGQPMLMSTAEAPFSSTQRAACSISGITCP